MTEPGGLTEPAKRRRLGHDERRALILDQACTLFARKTFTEVSMEDIAQAAGVTRGLLNHYFGTKRDLYLEVVRYLTRLPGAEDPGRSHVDLEGRSIEDTVARNVDLFLDNAERNRQFWLATLGGAGFGRDRQLEKVVADVEDAYVDRIIEIFGGDPAQAPAADRATLRGYGAFALAITRDWLADKRISREDAHAILRRTLLAIVRDLAAGDTPAAGQPLRPVGAKRAFPTR
jgi:AcrR family transcriptional regulator